MDTQEKVPTPRPGPQSKIWMPLAVIALAAGVSLMGVLISRTQRASGEKDIAAEARADLEKRRFKPLSGSLEALVKDDSYRPIPTQAHPSLGKIAPDFTLVDTDGKSLTLSEKWNDGPVALVFYYGYHCNHCVSQLFGLQKDVDKFRELGVTVVAVSADPSELTLERYKKYGKFAFPVVSDPGNKVAEQFAVFTPGVKEGDDGNLMHGTFVIDRGGKLVWANRGDEPFTENRTLLVEAHRRASGK